MAQITPERLVIASGGQQLTAGNLQLVSTLGEWATGPLTPSGTNLSTNLGFHQGDLMITDLDEWLDLGLPSLYPNPFQDQIFLSNPTDRTGILQIIDPLGHLVVLKEVKPQSPSESIWMGSFPAGAYIVRFKDSSNQTSSSLTLLKQ
jgi:hypothetical protein